MGEFELITIACALAMDAFAVAVATGVALGAVSFRQTFRMAWHFGLFQALMPIIGWYMGGRVQSYIEAYDHWIAFGLLAYIGYKMIRESFDDESAIRQDPTKGKNLVVLSIATSIDALAVGFSISVLKISIWYPALIIGIFALVITAIGLHFGRIAVQAKGLGKYAELLGGSVLIAIGLKILCNHGALPI